MQAIGKLDRRITLRTRTLVTQPSGQRIETFSDLATVWAALGVSTTGRGGGQEEQEAGMMVATRMNDFIIRYRPNIAPDMEVVFGGDTYRIMAVDEYSFKESFFRKRFLRLRCEWRDDINH